MMAERVFEPDQDPEVHWYRGRLTVTYTPKDETENGGDE